MHAFESLSYRGQVGRLRQLARTALTDYAVGEARLALLAHFDNTTFRVDTRDGDRYVLRVHQTSDSPSRPRRSVEEVCSEMMWLAALRRDTELVVPEPVPTRDGDLLTVVEASGVPDPRICTLFRWVEGRFVDAGLTPGHLERVGRFIARVQEHGEGWTPPEGFARGRVDNVSPDGLVSGAPRPPGVCELGSRSSGWSG